MPTREQLEASYGDTLRGLLMESFAEATRTMTTQHAANGAMMYRQLIRARALLDAIHEFYVPTPTKTPEVTDLMKQHSEQKKHATNGTHQPTRK